MRYASLFDGLGAAHLAAPAGWDCVASSEIDPHALAVLAHHWPSHRQVGDVTAFDWDCLHGSVDLVCGGSPCQSFSIAGKRLGLDDPRGNLALVFLDVVRRSGARWFVYENVPASCLPTADGTLAPSSGQWGNSGLGTATECLTLNTSEFPSGAVACSLSDILETGDLPQRYFLSPKACAGILRRAAKRGKVLPAHCKLP
jgi:hypothetical protein